MTTVSLPRSGRSETGAVRLSSCRRDQRRGFPEWDTDTLPAGRPTGCCDGSLDTRPASGTHRAVDRTSADGSTGGRGRRRERLGMAHPACRRLTRSASGTALLIVEVARRSMAVRSTARSPYQRGCTTDTTGARGQSPRGPRDETASTHPPVSRRSGRRPRSPVCAVAPTRRWPRTAASLHRRGVGAQRRGRRRRARSIRSRSRCVARATPWPGRAVEACGDRVEVTRSGGVAGRSLRGEVTPSDEPPHDARQNTRRVTHGAHEHSPGRRTRALP